MVKCCCGEVLSQKVGFNTVRVRTIRGHFEASRSDNPDVILPHQPSNATMPGRKATSFEGPGDTGAPVALLVLYMNSPDMHHQGIILPSAGTDRARAPISKTSVVYTK